MIPEMDSSQFAIEIERASGVALVRCRGRLVAGVRDSFYTEVSQLIPDNRRIVLDLTDLTQMVPKVRRNKIGFASGCADFGRRLFAAFRIAAHRHDVYAERGQFIGRCPADSAGSSCNECSRDRCHFTPPSELATGNVRRQECLRHRTRKLDSWPRFR
jgi:hypothetical protein